MGDMADWQQEQGEIGEALREKYGCETPCGDPECPDCKEGDDEQE